MRVLSAEGAQVECADNMCIALFFGIFYFWVYVYPPLFFCFIFFKHSTFIKWKPVVRWIVYLSGVLPLFLIWCPVILPPGVWPLEQDIYLSYYLSLIHYSLFYLFAILSVVEIKTRIFSIHFTRELRFFWLLLALMIWIGRILHEIEWEMTSIR